MWVEANTNNDANIRNKPYLLTATVTNFPANSVGKLFKYRLEAINSIGGTYSNYFAYTLAQAPAAPAQGP